LLALRAFFPYKYAGEFAERGKVREGGREEREGGRRGREGGEEGRAGGRAGGR